MGACGAFFSLRVLVSRCMRTSRWWCVSCGNMKFTLWFLPGTACLYSRPSPVDLACLRNHQLHACRYWYYGCHPQDTAVGRDRTQYSFSNVRAVVHGFSIAICAVSWLVYDVLVPGIFDAYSYDTHIFVVRCTGMKQKKDSAWSLVLRLATWVRADPK